VITEVLGALGTVVLGAFGSGLWDVVVKPSGLRVIQLVLSTVTLGSGAVKDRLYADAAKGPHEAVSLFMLGIVFSLYLGIPGFFLLCCRVCGSLRKN